MTRLDVLALRHRVILDRAPRSLLPWCDWALLDPSHGPEAAGRRADALTLLACYMAWEAEDALELDLDVELELAWDAAVAA